MGAMDARTALAATADNYPGKSPNVGAEIKGIDLSKPTDAALIREINAALDE